MWDQGQSVEFKCDIAVRKKSEAARRFEADWTENQQAGEELQ